MIDQKYPIPTGYLFTTKGSRGSLEALSIGDYGKSANIKADFLGFDKELSQGVPNQATKPLSEKWVITLSTQYGCTQKCTFCDVPNISFNGNATYDDLRDQFFDAISLFPKVRYTDRLNIHFARMGEPILNNNVFSFARRLQLEKHIFQEKTGLRAEVIHPVLTTSLPKRYGRVEEKLQEWCEIKNGLYHGQAGLQFSINSTDEEQRRIMFNGGSLSLVEFSKIAEDLPSPLSRKYCLNFAYSTDFIIDAGRLLDLFNPAKFMVKITPIHNNQSCRENGISTVGGYDSYAPYQKPEKELKEAGFDVLVFVPSMDEEQGLVTCGNLVLGGGEIQAESVVNIQGNSNVSLT